MAKGGKLHQFYGRKRYGRKTLHCLDMECLLSKLLFFMLLFAKLSLTFAHVFKILNEDYGIPSVDDILESMKISIGNEKDMLLDNDESDADISFNVSPIRKEDFNEKDENQKREISMFIEELISIVDEKLKTIVEHILVILKILRKRRTKELERKKQNQK